MYCIECGSSIYDAGKFCIKCGSSTSSDITKTTSVAQKNLSLHLNSDSKKNKLKAGSHKKIIAGGVIGAIAVGIASFFAYDALQAAKAKEVKQNLAKQLEIEEGTEAQKNLARKREMEEKAEADRRATEQAQTNNYQNVVACIHPNAPGLASQMVTNLLELHSSSEYGFSSAISNSTYAKYCQIAYGKPGEENIQMATPVTQTASFIYWVADRGNAAVGFIERKK
jgi:hypothetical protein